jgi:acetoacetate decarboxylase
MAVSGRLTKQDLGQFMPVHADPVSFATASFRGVDQLSFTYRTDTEAAVTVLPAQLEVEDDPHVTALFASYAFSSVGAFREYIHIIHARFEGELVGYIPHIFITNEIGMLAGREREGLPKLLADVDVDLGQGSPTGLLSAKLRRPADIVLAQAVFRPSELVRELTPNDALRSTMMGLRVIGSPIPGGPHAICELVPSSMEGIRGEVWSGDGTLIFTGASELSPVHRLPIRSEISAIAMRNPDFILHRATTTYPPPG